VCEKEDFFSSLFTPPVRLQKDCDNIATVLPVGVNCYVEGGRPIKKFRFSTKISFMSETIQGNARYNGRRIRTVKLVCDLSNGDIFSHLEWRLYNPGLRGTSLFDIEYLTNGTR